MSVPVKLVALEPQEIEINKNKRIRIALTVLPDNATDKSIDWSINNDKISFDEETLTITALKEGLSVLTATSVNRPDFKDYCLVTVLPAKLEDYQSRKYVTNADILPMPRYTAPTLRCNASKINVPYRGASDIEEWINFFNEVVHDLMLLGIVIDSNYSIHLVHSLREQLDNNLSKVLYGSTNPYLSVVKEGMSMYKNAPDGTTSLLCDDCSVLNINSSIDKESSLKQNLESIEVDISDLLCYLKEVSL